MGLCSRGWGLDECLEVGSVNKRLKMGRESEDKKARNMSYRMATSSTSSSTSSI